MALQGHATWHRHHRDRCLASVFCSMLNELNVNLHLRNTPIMTERHRALPSWMSKKEKEKVKEPLKSKRKPKTARSVFYCMNEKELVEAAVTYLTSARGDLQTEHQTGAKSAELSVEARRNPGTTFKPTTEALVEESSDSDAQDTTYVSESDLDITEAETLLYVSTENTQTDRDKVKEVQDKTEERQNENKDGGLEIQDNAKEEDDAFLLVKEIFFT